MSDSNRPLWQWSACELAEAIAARKVTAVDAVGDAVTRMRATNGKINAVVDDLGDAALREAEAHDKAMRTGGPIGPLHGVPVTIKENVDQKGCATPNGVVAFKDVIAPVTSETRLVCLGELMILEPGLARGRGIKPADNVEKSGFARPRGAENDDEFTGGGVEVHSA